MFCLDCDRSGNVRMRIVVLEDEIFRFVIEESLTAILDDQSGQGPRLSRKLKLRLLEMVGIEVAIAPGPDERPRLKFALARQHVGQQRVGCDIERNAQEDVRAALI